MNKDKYDDVYNYNENCNVIEIISNNLNIIKSILDKTKLKERTKKSNFFYSYVKKFSEQGVQGIVGVIILKKILKNDYNIKDFNKHLNKCSSGNNVILSKYFTDIINIKNIPISYFITIENKNIDNDTITKETGFPLVFKISVDMNNMILHESNIAKQLYNMHTYCPHFINILGDFTIPINSCYISLNSDQFDTDDEDYSDNDTDCDTENTDSENSDSENSDSENSVNSDSENDSENTDNEDETDEEYNIEFEKELERSKNIFHDAKDSFPRSIILYEKINNFPLHRYFKKTEFNNNLMSSQLLQMLLALQIAQNKFKFTHYDLHTTNVLQQRCEYDSVFLYNINNNKYLVPTYGYYPKIIDVGSSYSNEVNNHTMLTHANSYDYGFQTQFFDPLNDIHHSMLSLFYYIEDKKSCFESLCNKIKHIFYRLPVLRKSGWKKLPHDLTDTVLWKIKRDCLPEYEKYEIFRECKGNFLEILNSLVSIPFDKDLEQNIIDIDISEDIHDMLESHKIINFKNCFHSVMVELDKMFYNQEVCGEDIIYLLKELFFIINNNKLEIKENKIKLSIKYKELEEATENFESISKLKNIKSNKNNQKLLNQYTTVLNKVKKEVDVLEKVYKKIKQEIKEKTQTFIQSYVEYDNVNYYNLVNGFIDTSYNVQCIYYLLTKEHQNIIKNVYEKTIIKEPLDMFEYLSRNFTPSFNIDKNTIVYYWDTDNKEHKMYSNFFDENNKNHTLINILPFNKKANKLFELITT
jgi:hypothetical protein